MNLSLKINVINQYNNINDNTIIENKKIFILMKIKI